MHSGVHTAVVTPFSDGEVDLEAYGRLVERQLAGGVDGIVVCGTTGETPTLKDTEWAELVKATVAICGGRAVVTAGTGTNCTRSSVERTEWAKDLGADAALVVLPYYNKPNPRGHVTHMEAVASVGLPVMAYHVPGRTGQRVPVSLLARLANLDGVVSVKEATGDVGYGSDLIARTDRPVLSGDDFTYYPLMCVGGAGVVSVVSNVDPVKTVALARAVADSKLALARRLHHELMPLVHWLFADSNPVPAKAALATMGLCSDEVRLPLAAGSAPPAELIAGIQ